mmetsp:Transcript_62557/g.111491  ORF Transcript_62557/g.111491 Transcript_62557/m.111491 type:complete len:100 (-) Transcript_62557:423-722(-)
MPVILVLSRPYMCTCAVHLAGVATADGTVLFQAQIVPVKIPIKCSGTPVDRPLCHSIHYATRSFLIASQIQVVSRLIFIALAQGKNPKFSKFQAQISTV